SGRPPPRWWQPAPPVSRSVAQPGRAAPSYGAGRRFESCRSVPRPSAPPRTLAAAHCRRGRAHPRPARCTIARRALTTRAPVLEALVLPELEAAGPEGLAAQGSFDALLLADADLTGRDLAGITLTECALRGAAAHSAVLKHCRLIETRVERLPAPVPWPLRRTRQ